MGNAGFRRKPHCGIVTGKRRKLQEPAENRRLAFVPLRFVPLSAALEVSKPNPPLHGDSLTLTLGQVAVEVPFVFSKLPSDCRGAKTRVRKKGSFGEGVFSEKSRDSRDFGESPDAGKQRSIRPFSRDSADLRDFRDSRDSSSEKTPFVMTPFSGKSGTGWQACQLVGPVCFLQTEIYPVQNWSLEMP